MSITNTKKAIRELPDGRLYIVQGVNDEPHKVNATTADLKALVDRLDELEEEGEKLGRLLDAVDEIVEAHWEGGDVRAAIRRFEKVRANTARLRKAIEE